MQNSNFCKEIVENKIADLLQVNRLCNHNIAGIDLEKDGKTYEVKALCGNLCSWHNSFITDSKDIRKELEAGAVADYYILYIGKKVEEDIKLENLQILEKSEMINWLLPRVVLSENKAKQPKLRFGIRERTGRATYKLEQAGYTLA